MQSSTDCEKETLIVSKNASNLNFICSSFNYTNFL